MTASKSTSTPERTPETVFFVGNGVMRVAPLLPRADETDDGDLPPSWAEYMLDLWTRIDKGHPDFIALDEFSRLVGPRQAEWFDRLFRPATTDRCEAAAFRMHLLGKTLHRSKSVLSNRMLKDLAWLIVDCAASRAEQGLTADVITTNVDCLLEQNLAAEIDERLSTGGAPFGAATIESVVDFRSSALWRRTNSAGASTLSVRIWKVHGCLRDLKLQLESEAPRVVDAVLTKDNATEFCGEVPTNQLADNLKAVWQQTAAPAQPGQRLSGAFSQSEYFDNLDVLIRHTSGAVLPQSTGAQSTASTILLTQFCDLLKSRPLIFVGYSIPEVDVDVIYALHRHRQTAGVMRWQLTSDRSVSSCERLRQLGIESARFTVPAMGSAAVPGKLNAAARHEWRTISAEPPNLSAKEDWHSAIQRVSSRAWLEPQLEKFRSLGLPAQHARAALPSDPGHRLVVAGLGSIWHGFAVPRDSDFPAMRRASAQMVSVDQQVPGGSGLVPVVIAAALAGPRAVGKFAFFSNVPSRWSGWAAIQDLCLSAGIDTRSWDSSQADEGAQAVGRTSHIIFFDADEEDAGSGRSRQRFIMDVQSLADDRSTPKDGNWSALQVPKASTQHFQQQGQEDFLFADKEASPQSIELWKGPIVYETGTTGLELVNSLRKNGVQPHIWTAGVGSFIRTMVELADPPLTDDIRERGFRAVLCYLRKHEQLKAFSAGHNKRRNQFLVKVLGFNCAAIWDHRGVGFDYDDEKAYSTWLRDNWTTLAPNIWALLGTGTDKPVLKAPYERIGGGLVTTIHDGGLMALWQHGDKPKESIVVEIDTAAIPDVPCGLKVTCTLIREPKRSQPEKVYIYVNSDSVVLNVDGHTECCFGRTDPIRRNSLAAGDTVRGVMAYGLWEAAYGSNPDRPVDIPRIMLASAALASLKCYAGSFIDFLEMLEELRGTPAWDALWTTTA
jgi:hypothetical protein